MWLIIEVEEPKDIGKNELRRLKLSDQFTNIKPRCEHVKNIGIVFDIVTTGVEVHPATEPEESLEWGETIQ